MTERGETALLQSPHGLDIGPSALRASDAGLEIDIQERATPFGQRVVGQVSVSFERPSEECFELDGVGEHWWWPIAPIAGIKVALERPGLRWSGAAYVDSNYGSRPIETGFASWNWCRGHDAEGDCQIHYDAQLSGGGEKRLSLTVDRSGALVRTPSPDLQQLRHGPIWRVARPARLPHQAGRVRTLEDTPFYTRSEIQVGGGQFMHESLDLHRFCRPWVQFLLPFRMPRKG